MGKVPCIAFEVCSRRGVAVTDGWTVTGRGCGGGSDKDGKERGREREGERGREIWSVLCVLVCVLTV